MCVIAAGAATCGPLVLAGCGGGGAAFRCTARNRSGLAAGSHRRKDMRPRDITAGYDTTVLNDSPLAFYRMNDATNTLTDAGPNALNGTYGRP